VIIEAATALHRLQEENFWITLNQQKLEFLRTEIKPLFRTISEADFKAMRFERDLLEYSLAKLSEEKEKAETLKEGIVEQISELPLSVNFVKAEESLIRAAQTGYYWSKAEPLEVENALDELCVRLGPLMKFREQNLGPRPIHLDLTDALHHKDWVEFGPQHEAVSISQYREMVEAVITELTEQNPVLLKIKKGEEVTPSEANELAELLHAEHPHHRGSLAPGLQKPQGAFYPVYPPHPRH
jgi:type I restriction enzyme R subunit